MLNFGLLEKGLGIVSPPYFVNDFLEKYFSYYIQLTDQVSLPGCLYFLGYWVKYVLQWLAFHVMT